MPNNSVDGDKFEEIIYSKSQVQTIVDGTFQRVWAPLFYTLQYQYITQLNGLAEALQEVYNQITEWFIGQYAKYQHKESWVAYQLYYMKQSERWLSLLNMMLYSMALIPLELEQAIMETKSLTTTNIRSQNEFYDVTKAMKTILSRSSDVFSWYINYDKIKSMNEEFHHICESVKYSIMSNDKYSWRNTYNEMANLLEMWTAYKLLNSYNMRYDSEDNCDSLKLYFNLIFYTIVKFTAVTDKTMIDIWNMWMRYCLFHDLESMTSKDTPLSLYEVYQNTSQIIQIELINYIAYLVIYHSMNNDIPFKETVITARLDSKERENMQRQLVRCIELEDIICNLYHKIVKNVDVGLNAAYQGLRLRHAVNGNHYLGSSVSQVPSTLSSVELMNHVVSSVKLCNCATEYVKAHIQALLYNLKELVKQRTFHTGCYDDTNRSSFMEIGMSAVEVLIEVIPSNHYYEPQRGAIEQHRLDIYEPWINESYREASSFLYKEIQPCNSSETSIKQLDITNITVMYLTATYYPEYVTIANLKDCRNQLAFQVVCWTTLHDATEICMDSLMTYLDGDYWLKSASTSTIALLLLAAEINYRSIKCRRTYTDMTPISYQESLFSESATPDKTMQSMNEVISLRRVRLQLFELDQLTKVVSRWSESTLKFKRLDSEEPINIILKSIKGIQGVIRAVPLEELRRQLEFIHEQGVDEAAVNSDTVTNLSMFTWHLQWSIMMIQAGLFMVETINSIDTHPYIRPDTISGESILPMIQNVEWIVEKGIAICSCYSYFSTPMKLHSGSRVTHCPEHYVKLWEWFISVPVISMMDTNADNELNRAISVLSEEIRKWYHLYNNVVKQLL